MNSRNEIPHTETIPTLSGNFSNKMVNAEVSAAAPPMADVALNIKQRAINASRSTIWPQNLKNMKAIIDTSLFKKPSSHKGERSF